MRGKTRMEGGDTRDVVVRHERNKKEKTHQRRCWCWCVIQCCLEKSAWKGGGTAPGRRGRMEEGGAVVARHGKVICIFTSRARKCWNLVGLGFRHTTTHLTATPPSKVPAPTVKVSRTFLFSFLFFFFFIPHILFAGPTSQRPLPTRPDAPPTYPLALPLAHARTFAQGVHKGMLL
jgi:hypothetical protein